MTQITFIGLEDITANRLNQATQGYKFLRRTTYAGSASSPVGSGPSAVSCVTWIVGSGTAALFVRVCGAGAGGGACQGGSPAGTSGAGSGGGGGGYNEKWILSGFGSQQVVRIGRGGTGGSVAGNLIGGTGGTSAFGALMSATSGSGGLFVNNTGAFLYTTGGDGGFAVGGDLNQGGSGGGVGYVFEDNNAVLSGRGGQSAFGGSGGRELTSGANGANGNLYGGGGGGAAVERAASLTSQVGGNGAPGFVVVDEYA